MPETFGVYWLRQTQDSRQPVTKIGAYYTAKGMPHAAAPRPAAGSSLIGVCAWFGNAEAIKPTTRMFVDDHPSRRLWEPSQ
jgi:hypothetical protein